MKLDCNDAISIESDWESMSAPLMTDDPIKERGGGAGDTELKSEVILEHTIPTITYIGLVRC